jgi:hypothetical protein
MSRQRLLYVTQDSLTVWQRRRSDPECVAEFDDSDQGLRSFDTYMAANSDQTSFLLVDVIEEEFTVDNVPTLNFRDRKALMLRRLQRKFPRTPYRLPVYQGKATRGAEEATVVHSAISNHELLDPWLQVMLRHEIPLAGIYSVPLMGPELMRRLSKTKQPVLLLTQHHGQKLRQVFMQNGHVQSARLSQSPAIADEEYPQFVLTEIGRSRRYLERARLLSNLEQLDVYIVAESSLAERILACEKRESPLQIHFVRPDKAAQKVGLVTAPPEDRLESLYLALSFQRRPRHNYAVSGESRFSRMRRIRHAAIAAAVTVGCACSAAAGLNLSDAWFLGRQVAEIEQQLERLTATFHGENAAFDPIQADSHEMKLAVDTGNFILSNRLPVPWVMQQIGMVMGDYPDIQILALGWTADSSAETRPERQRGDRPKPVPVPPITAVNAVITAEIQPFDGNMRRAFMRIDQLARELGSRTEFVTVETLEYPLDASPEASISGEIVGAGNFDSARFQLLLRLPLDAVAVDGGEAGDESA